MSKIDILVTLLFLSVAGNVVQMVIGYVLVDQLELAHKMLATSINEIGRDEVMRNG